MTEPVAGDRVKVTITVKVDPATAFDVFTRETDLWWRRGPKYRVAGRHPGTLGFEPGAGGRLFESFETAGRRVVHVVGRVTVWDPPARLVFTWRNANFSPEESTEVDVRFEAAGAGTRVTVEHRGWASLRADHPARHGLEGSAFSRMIGLWWGELTTSYREHIDARVP